MASPIFSLQQPSKQENVPGRYLHLCGRKAASDHTERHVYLFQRCCGSVGSRSLRRLQGVLLLLLQVLLIRTRIMIRNLCFNSLVLVSSIKHLARSLDSFISETSILVLSPSMSISHEEDLLSSRAWSLTTETENDLLASLSLLTKQTERCLCFPSFCFSIQFLY